MQSLPALLCTRPHLDGDARMVFLQVLQADLQVQLPSPCDDVLPRLLNDALQQARNQPRALTSGHAGTPGNSMEWLESRLQASLQLEKVDSPEMGISGNSGLMKGSKSSHVPPLLFCWFSALPPRTICSTRPACKTPTYEKELDATTPPHYIAAARENVCLAHT